MDFRPRWHFTPEKNWINDPNGLIWHDGLYHLYYQHNPFGTAWGHMSWGHATSEDLIHWNEHPVAIAENADSGEAIFSGSAVFDELGDSGTPGSIVACYTSHTGTPGAIRQYQSLAISTDGGYTFTKQGPVLDKGLSDFRDPKVFRYKDEWRMVVVHSIDCKVEILRSKNLRDWESLSFFSAPETVGVIWECPDLFELEMAGGKLWVMIVSVNPGGPLNGSGTKYFVGEFDGTTYTPIQSAKWLDFGRDNYAGVTYNNEPNAERILIGWMNSWGKTTHPELPWTGAMTIPRRLSLSELEGEIWVKQDPVLEPNLKVVLDASNDYSHRFNSELTASYDKSTGVFEIAGYQAQLPIQDSPELEVLVDNCSIEVFLKSRTVSFTFLTFAE